MLRERRISRQPLRADAASKDQFNGLNQICVRLAARPHQAIPEERVIRHVSLHLIAQRAARNEVAVRIGAPERPRQLMVNGCAPRVPCGNTPVDRETAVVAAPVVALQDCRH